MTKMTTEGSWESEPDPGWREDHTDRQTMECPFHSPYFQTPVHGALVGMGAILADSSFPVRILAGKKKIST